MPENIEFKIDAKWLNRKLKSHKKSLNLGDLSNVLQNYHFHGIDFLIRQFYRKLKGVILNEEDDMNMQLQTCVFLKSLLSNAAEKHFILIIIPDHLLSKWMYHLHQVKLIPNLTKKLGDFFEEEIVLIPFSLIKACEDYLDSDIFCVIVDEIHEVSKKLVIKKLRGSFNVAITSHNFYKFPNKKTQWEILNWSNPGCVGNFTTFCENDLLYYHLPELNFKNAYEQWWFRLTWQFCDSFQKSSLQELQAYRRTLSEFANTKSLVITDPNKTRKKRKLEEVTSDQDEQTSSNEEFDLNRSKSSDDFSNSSNTSNETVIYELEAVDRKTDYVQLPSMDENPILSSIIRNLQDSPQKDTVAADDVSKKVSEYSILQDILSNKPMKSPKYQSYQDLQSEENSKDSGDIFKSLVSQGAAETKVKEGESEDDDSRRRSQLWSLIFDD